MRFDHTALELHRDYSRWYYDFAFGCAIEMPTHAVRAVLPPRLHPSEVRPGVSLLLVNVLRFLPDNHGFDRPFTELTLSVSVVPDLYLAGRLPRFAAFILNVGVTDLAFAADAYNTDRLPFHDRALVIRLDETVPTVHIADADGPILEIDNLAPGGGSARKEDFFQVFARSGDELLHGAMTLDADVHEHQATGTAGRLFPHAIFRGLVRESQAAENYMQMFTPMDPFGIQHYYRLRPLEPAGRLDAAPGDTATYPAATR